VRKLGILCNPFARKFKKSRPWARIRSAYRRIFLGTPGYIRLLIEEFDVCGILAEEL